MIGRVTALTVKQPLSRPDLLEYLSSTQDPEFYSLVQQETKQATSWSFLAVIRRHSISSRRLLRRHK